MKDWAGQKLNNVSNRNRFRFFYIFHKNNQKLKKAIQTTHKNYKNNKKTIKT